MSAELSYSPGTRYLATGPRLTILSSDGDLVRRMWPVVRDGGDAAAVLVDALGGGLLSLADLVLIDGDAAHAELLVRGDVEVHLETAAKGEQTVDGRGVRTWREVSVDDIDALAVGSMTEPDAELPLTGGLVRAAGFRWVTASSARHAADALSEAAETVAPAEKSAAEAAAPAAAAWPPPTEPVTSVPVTPAPPAATTPVVPDETRLGPEDEFGHLFESTILRGAEDAAVRIDPDAEDQPAADHDVPSPGAALGDHDGATILGSQLSALLKGQTAQQSVPPSPQESARFELVFSTGQVVPVDQPVVVGRKPQADRVSGGEIPRLITVSGPNNDVSRSHLTIRADRDGLLATDLGSTNGTFLVGPTGSRPLVARTPERIAAGARLDLGDGVTIDVRAVS